jgi:type IX secretion system PorP/SprF family membrane protein
MKIYLLAIIGLCCAFSVNGQSRAEITNFSLFQQFYNPALTGNAGSVVKSLYRNQWTGFEDAPKTVFVSGELLLPDLQTRHLPESRRRSNSSVDGNAFGLSVLHRSFGAYSDAKVNLSYAAVVPLSEKIVLRWGSALTYTSNRLDGTKLSVVGDDPKYQNLLGQNNRKSKIDLDLGIAITTENFYLAYALQDVAKRGVLQGGDDFFEDSYSRKQVVQAGYRTYVSEHVGVVVNSIFAQDKLQKNTVEGQVKVVYNDMFWAGGGYRKELAYNLTAGIKLNQFKIGYAYEMPAGEASSIPHNTNEILISYKLWSAAPSRQAREFTIW